MIRNDRSSPAAEMGRFSQKWRQAGVFVLTYASYCGLYSTRKPFSVVKVHIQEGLGVSTYALGAIDTAFLGMYALGQLFVPALTERYAEAPVVLFCAFLGSAACAVGFGSASSPTLMFACWFLNGIFHSAVYPLLVRSLAPWFSASVRGQVLGTWTTSQQLGSLLATAFATYAAGTFGWRSTFFFPAAVVGSLGIALFKFLPSPSAANVSDEGPPHLGPLSTGRRSASYVLKSGTGGNSSANSPVMRRVAADSGATYDVTSGTDSEEAPAPKSAESDASPTSGELTDCSSSCASGGASTSKGISVSVPSSRGVKAGLEIEEPNDIVGSARHGASTRISVREVLAIKDLKNVAAAYFSIKCVRYSLLFWLPFYLTNGLGYSKTTAGYSSMMFDLGGIPGAIFTGFLSDFVLSGRRLFAAAIMAIASAMALIAFSLTSQSGSLLATTAVMTLVGFTLAGPDSVLGAAAAQDLCERSGVGSDGLAVATGLVNGMGSCGAVLQGFLTASISQVYGWDSLFSTLCVCLVLAVLLLLPTLSRDGGRPRRKSFLQLRQQTDEESATGQVQGARRKNSRHAGSSGNDSMAMASGVAPKA